MSLFTEDPEPKPPVHWVVTFLLGVFLCAIIILLIAWGFTP
jgi:hypothetical protein